MIHVDGGYHCIGAPPVDPEAERALEAAASASEQKP
jgi:hypothetical protein